MADAPQPNIRAEVGGATLSVIESGAARLQAILDLIAGAKTSVRLLFYIFSSDASGLKVRDALVDAAARGVDVRVLLDGFGSADADPELFKPLADAGGRHCSFHPRYGRRYLMRNHQKLVVIDDARVLTGGANIEDSYLVDSGERYWRDLWLVVEGKEPTAVAAGYFDALYDWTTTKGASLRQLRAIVGKHSQTDGPLQWKFTAPLSRRNPWAVSIVRDINGANRLDIVAAYFSPPRSMLRRMARLAGRGAVRVITAAKSDNQATIAAARHTYHRLLRRGVEMYEYEATRLHSKLIIADDVVHIGSPNFDFRSFYINLEVVLRIDDAAFAAQMRGYFEGEIADSRQITPALHRKRATLWSRLKWTLSHWLVTSMDYTVTRRLNFRT